MTPRKLRPLRELRRLRRLAEQADEQSPGRDASGEKPPTAGSELPVRVNRMMIAPGVISDIQVLVEAGHSNSISAPRAGFIASLAVDGRMSSIDRIRTPDHRPVPSPETVAAGIENIGAGVVVLGLIDQVDPDNPDSGLLSFLTNNLVDFILPERYLLLSHNSKPTGSGNGKMSLPSNPANLSASRISWTSWNEQHELSAMSGQLRPIAIGVV